MTVGPEWIALSESGHNIPEGVIVAIENVKGIRS
jgi:hypothetical protein